MRKKIKYWQLILDVRKDFMQIFMSSGQNIMNKIIKS